MQTSCSDVAPPWWKWPHRPIEVGLPSTYLQMIGEAEK
jgi:hypothetical protein